MTIPASKLYHQYGDKKQSPIGTKTGKRTNRKEDPEIKDKAMPT